MASHTSFERASYVFSTLIGSWFVLLAAILIFFILQKFKTQFAKNWPVTFTNLQGISPHLQKECLRNNGYSFSNVDMLPQLSSVYYQIKLQTALSTFLIELFKYV